MFFFEDYHSTAVSLFESMAKQLLAALLCSDTPGTFKIFKALETAYGNSISRPTISQVVTELVIPLCTRLPDVTLLIDGIDECRREEANLVWQWLGKLLKEIPARVLITSEDQTDVPRRLKGFDFSRIRVDQQNQKDLDMCIDEHIARKSGPGQLYCEKLVREGIKTKLREKAKGMYVLRLCDAKHAF